MNIFRKRNIAGLTQNTETLLLGLKEGHLKLLRRGVTKVLSCGRWGIRTSS